MTAHSHKWPQPKSAKLTFADPVYEIKITCSRPLSDQEIEGCVQAMQAKLYELRNQGVTGTKP